jgi:pimeloyl-ACP methyl ester carboxylesterase
MRPRLHAALLVAVAAVAWGCGDNLPVGPTTSAAEARSVVSTENGVRWTEGEIGPGARYSMFVPEAWNGQLILYSHGYRDPDSPVDLRDQDNLGLLRERMVAQGYAVAYSSYSENGYAVRDGMLRTSQLSGIFASHFGKPARTLLMGHSMGGLIALGLAERFPERYAGALVMCGISGGSRLEVDYIGQIRVLFDFFYPGVLPGTLLELPAGVRPLEDVTLPAQQAMTASLATGSTASMQGAFAIAALMEGLGMPIPFIQTLGPQTAIQTLAGSITYALTFHARAFEDLIDRTHEHSPFDNAATVYTGALAAPVLAAVNAGVQRYTINPDAQAYLEHNYAPTGNLQIPVVLLDNPFDPIAPGFHADGYRDRVNAAGASALLVERRSANPFAYGHCAMSVDDTMGALQELTTRLPS